MHVPKTSLLSIRVLLMSGANVHSENVTVSGQEEMNDNCRKITTHKLWMEISLLHQLRHSFPLFQVVAFWCYSTWDSPIVSIKNKQTNKQTNQHISQHTNVPFFNSNVKTTDSSNCIFYRWPAKHTLQANSQIPYYFLRRKDVMKNLHVLNSVYCTISMVFGKSYVWQYHNTTVLNCNTF